MAVLTGVTCKQAHSYNQQLQHIYEKKRLIIKLCIPDCFLNLLLSGFT
jgi:hypothetical protein